MGGLQLSNGITIGVGHGAVGPIEALWNEQNDNWDVRYSALNMFDGLNCYVAKGFFDGGTDLCIYSEKPLNIGKSEGDFKYVCGETLRAIQHELDGILLDKVSAAGLLERDNVLTVRVHDIDSAALQGCAVPHRTDPDTLYVLNDVGYPGLSGSVVECNNRVLGLYLARLTSRNPKARAPKLKAVIKTCNSLSSVFKPSVPFNPNRLRQVNGDPTPAAPTPGTLSNLLARDDGPPERDLDVSTLSEGEFRSLLLGNFNALRSDVRSDVNALRSDVRSDIDSLRSDFGEQLRRRSIVRTLHDVQQLEFVQVHKKFWFDVSTKRIHAFDADTDIDYGIEH